MLINGFYDFRLIICREFGPRNLDFLLSVLFYPNLGNSITSVRLLAAPPYNMDMSSVLRRIGREHG